MPAPDRQLTARDVILEIVHNMQEGVEPLLYSSLAPAVYYVSLHPDDFDRLSPVAGRVVEEAGRALDDELERRNAGNRLVPGPVRRWLNQGPPIERPREGWTIHLQPDPDGDLIPGHFAVTSELSLPPRPQFDGTETRRITTTQRGAHSETSKQTLVSTADTSRSLTATLTYTDAGGPRSFVMDKDRIAIGRGGTGYWVDVRLDAPPDISREHLRIRRDLQGQGFLVKDVSTYGTTLDGVPLPRAAGDESAAGDETVNEVPLPPRARLVLAGLVTIDFEQRRDR